MPSADDRPPQASQATPTVVAHMMTPGVVQVPGDVSVSEAALLLEREHAPCLLVKDTETMFGLMTPTDIVKKVVAQGLEPHETEVRSIMSRPVQFIEYDEALEEASSLMMSTGASLLIVTKHNQPVGVLSAQDLMLNPPRRQATIPTVVTVVRAQAQTAPPSAHNAMILQLSHVGALIESAANLPSKTAVALAFSLPGQHTPLTIHGKVMSSGHSCQTSYQQGQGPVAMEIQFADLSQADLARLRAWALQALPPSSQ